MTYAFSNSTVVNETAISVSTNMVSWQPGGNTDRILSSAYIFSVAIYHHSNGSYGAAVLLPPRPPDVTPEYKIDSELMSPPSTAVRLVKDFSPQNFTSTACAYNNLTPPGSDRGLMMRCVGPGVL